MCWRYQAYARMLQLCTERKAHCFCEHLSHLVRRLLEKLHQLLHFAIHRFRSLVLKRLIELFLDPLDGRINFTFIYVILARKVFVVWHPC